LKRTVSKNQRTSLAKVTAELGILTWRPCFHTAVWRELHDIHGRDAIAKLLIIENNIKWLKIWRDNHKIWMADNWKYITWSDESSFMFPTSFWVNVWSMPKTACHFNYWLKFKK
jgi:hypothetical protein